MKSIIELVQRNERVGIGLMSGSSCDGVDAAAVRIHGSGSRLHAALLAFETFPYDDAIRGRLLTSNVDLREICALDMLLGEMFARAVETLRRSTAMKGVTVDFVASHGHTLAHLPPESDGDYGTLQIASSAVIAQRTGLPVVSQFRQADMAAGGQGAPLVPYADWALFHHPDQTVACLNIGGIANVTVVTPELERVVAYDTGPGNMPIDGAIRTATDGKLQFDEDGKLAAAGTPNQSCVQRLLAHPYFDAPPPKSTGREVFAAEVFLSPLGLSESRMDLADQIATVTHAVGQSIVESIRRFVLPRYRLARLIVSGGGAHNHTIMGILERELAPVEVVVSDMYGWPGDAREAVAFAILGSETLSGVPANVPSATGASSPAILGALTVP